MQRGAPLAGGLGQGGGGARPIPRPHPVSREHALRQLVDKLHATYTDHLKQTWAPQVLYRLNREVGRLQAADRALGVPAVPEPPEGAALADVRAKACAASRLLLHPQALQQKVQGCSAALKARLQALTARADDVTEGPALMALLTEGRTALQEAEDRYDADVRAALEADTSEFKMGRFAPFINAVVARLQAQKFLPTAQQRPLDELLREAAEATTDWVEACRAERL